MPYPGMNCHNLIEIDNDEETNCRWITLYPSEVLLHDSGLTDAELQRETKYKNVNHMSRTGVRNALLFGHVCELVEENDDKA